MGADRISLTAENMERITEVTESRRRHKQTHKSPQTDMQTLAETHRHPMPQLHYLFPSSLPSLSEAFHSLSLFLSLPPSLSLSLSPSLSLCLFISLAPSFLTDSSFYDYLWLHHSPRSLSISSYAPPLSLPLSHVHVPPHSSVAAWSLCLAA